MKFAKGMNMVFLINEGLAYFKFELEMSDLAWRTGDESSELVDPDLEPIVRDEVKPILSKWPGFRGYVLFSCSKEKYTCAWDNDVHLYVLVEEPYPAVDDIVSVLGNSWISRPICKLVATYLYRSKIYHWTVDDSSCNCLVDQLPMHADDPKIIEEEWYEAERAFILNKYQMRLPIIP